MVRCTVARLMAAMGLRGALGGRRMKATLPPVAFCKRHEETSLAAEYSTNPVSEKAATVEKAEDQVAHSVANAIVHYGRAWKDARKALDFGLGKTNPSQSSGDLPTAYSLSLNCPPPSKPKTHIRYELPTTSDVRLGVFNAFGRAVRILVRDTASGRYVVRFNAGDLASGAYLYRLGAGDFRQDPLMISLK